MNYIKRLEKELEEANAAKKQAEESAEELRSYLLSSKFRSGDSLDNYVNVSDVLNRLEAIISPLR